MSQDFWLQNYDAACRMAQEIAEHIHERNRLQRTGGNPAKLNMTLRASLQKLKQNIAQLRDTLNRAAVQRQIMQAEADRRQNLVDDLATRETRLNASFKGDISEAEPARSSLMTGGNGGSGPAVNPWLINESEETRGLGFGEIKHQQQQIIEAQDAGLDALAAVISRQKQMGQEIGNELEEQNEIIDDLTQLVDKTDGRIKNETHRVKLLETKSASCGMWVVIVLLLIAIIVVAAWQ
ncbi:syntaxin-8 isoform X1 [Pimephales promelas]|uniref:syntaxin-8 isoform X1 n=1 Tax=Pimephales promelas TaxID=90988 RepID=UPI001955A61B|nr:syntaxin-8 isoform X1 [Pimephales promelas]XP_039547491.1 syntaxin-8 isoform X1 [Pimephales promelas]KAG1940764.1 syntaxin [Pimephales promelas]KAG1940768.1 syntaxin [Pimephales promelas]